MSLFRSCMAAPLVSLIALWAVPASACYTGPMPIAFAGGTAHLTAFSKRVLADYAEMRGVGGKDRVLVIFYGEAPTRASDKVLRFAREQTIRGYLHNEGVPTRMTSVVTTRWRLPRDLAELDEGARPVATVELTVGCGN